MTECSELQTNNWEKFYAHVVNFQNDFDLHGLSLIAIEIEDANADELTSPGAGSLSPTTQANES